MAPSVLIGLALIIWGLAHPASLDAASLSIFVVGVGSVGLLHGALDHLVAFRLFPSRVGWMSFLAGYLGVMAAYILLWFLAPIPALALFIALTIWHFGQADANGFGWKEADRLLAVSRSLAVLGLLFGASMGDVAAILKPLMAWPVPETYGPWFAAGALITHLAALAWVRPDGTWRATADIGLIGVLAFTTPLLVGFTAYFALWHSMGHIRELRSFLNLPGWWDVVRLGLPFTVIAAIGVAGAVYATGTDIRPADGLVYGFAAISVLTLPHVLLVDRMLKKT